MYLSVPDLNYQQTDEYFINKENLGTIPDRTSRCINNFIIFFTKFAKKYMSISTWQFSKRKFTDDSAQSWMLS